MRPEDPARHWHRQVILTQVQHWGVGGQSHVCAIVDREQPAVLLAGAGEHFQQTEFLARLESLLAQLHDVHSGTEHGVEELRQIAPGPPGAGAQIQPGIRQAGPQLRRCGLVRHGAIQSPPEPWS
jgi:hypothetical protein